MLTPGKILFGGLLAALLASGGLYYTRTNLCCPPASETAQPLEWLKTEYQLSEADFARIKQLHEAYLPRCAEMCQRIEDKRQELANLLTKEAGVTPIVEKALSDLSQLHAACEAQMLKHFYAVSKAMPVEQGKRYLTWVQEQTLLASHQKGGMQLSAPASSGSHAGHQHGQ